MNTDKILTVFLIFFASALPLVFAAVDESPPRKVEHKTDVPFLEYVCGNGVCEPQESYESCPNDCKSGGKDDYCDKISDGICDADCMTGQDADCASGSSYPVIAIFAIAAVVSGIWYYRRKKSKRLMSGFVE